MPIRVQSRDEGPIKILEVVADPPREGTLEIDLLSAEILEEALEGAVSEGVDRIMVDVGGVSYIHSKAFWSLVHAGETLIERGGLLVLIRVTPYLARLIDLTSASESIETGEDFERGMAVLERI